MAIGHPCNGDSPLKPWKPDGIDILVAGLDI